MLRRIDALEAVMKALYNPLQSNVTNLLGDVTTLQADVATLKTKMAAVLYCSSIQKTYDPTNPAKDARGCVAIPAVIDPNVAKMLYCGARSKFYDPTNPAKDVQGCAPPDVKLVKKSTHSASAHMRGGPESDSVGPITADMCTLSHVGIGTIKDNHQHTCSVLKTAAGWTLTATHNAAYTYCTMDCFDFAAQ